MGGWESGPTEAPSTATVRCSRRAATALTGPVEEGRHAMVVSATMVRTYLSGERFRLPCVAARHCARMQISDALLPTRPSRPLPRQ
jgi:hypothetical protein